MTTSAARSTPVGLPSATDRAFRSDVPIPIEWVVGPVGALALALLWIHDLRKERDILKERLYKLLDKIDVVAK